ncbi:hypothetical protein ACQP2F_46430 (plasmid) [Actinoplanes sp. CA-030573]|uniref:hypothetical protein n=1 Tax=Actinoplanes sp. CA-030573 TaxID=3239898 RepID=UPI003D914C3D
MTELTHRQLEAISDAALRFVDSLTSADARDLLEGRKHLVLVDVPGAEPAPIYERPCGCRTEEGVFMPCADHQISDLGQPYGEEADR